MKSVTPRLFATFEHSLGIVQTQPFDFFLGFLLKMGGAEGPPIPSAPSEGIVGWCQRFSEVKDSDSWKGKRCKETRSSDKASQPEIQIVDDVRICHIVS